MSQLEQQLSNILRLHKRGVITYGCALARCMQAIKDYERCDHAGAVSAIAAMNLRLPGDTARMA